VVLVHLFCDAAGKHEDHLLDERLVLKAPEQQAGRVGQHVALCVQIMQCECVWTTARQPACCNHSSVARWMMGTALLVPVAVLPAVTITHVCYRALYLGT
jgi:hypothetical protein